MRVSSALAVATFLFASVVNPAYFAGCGGSSESEPEFGEAEMLALLDVANEQGRWTFESAGREYEIELSLLQVSGEDAFGGIAPLRGGAMSVTRAMPGMLSGATARACGTRRFMNRAAACVTVSELPVEGELTLREVSPMPRVVATNVSVEGRLWTDAYHLVFATIDLQFGASSVTLHSDDARRFELHRVDAVAADLGATDGIQFDTGENF